MKSSDPCSTFSFYILHINTHICLNHATHQENMIKFTVLFKKKSRSSLDLHLSVCFIGKFKYKKLGSFCQSVTWIRIFNLFLFLIYTCPLIRLIWISLKSVVLCKPVMAFLYHWCHLNVFLFCGLTDLFLFDL